MTFLLNFFRKLSPERWMKLTLKSFELLEFESLKSIGGVGGNCRSIGDMNKFFDDILNVFFDFSLFSQKIFDFTWNEFLFN